jgi:hypothetical protein
MASFELDYCEGQAVTATSKLSQLESDKLSLAATTKVRVFISYAKVNNLLHLGTRVGRVDRLEMELRNRLAEEVGRQDRSWAFRGVTYFRLNSVCRKIQRLDALLKPEADK